MATQSENFDKEKSHLEHLLDSAMIVEDSENKHLRQREILVQFEDCNEELADRCIRMLQVWGWPTNPAKQLWTTDPKIGSKQLEGVWRKVSAFQDPRRGRGIFVMLREGFAQELDWKETFVLETDDLQEDERYLLFAVPNLHPQYAQSISDNFSTHSTTNFTIDGKARGGTWEFIHKRLEQENNDGAYTLKVFAAKPQFTFYTYDNYGTIGQTKVTYVQNVPKRLAQSVVGDYDDVGTSGSGNYSTSEGVVDLTFRIKDGAAITITNIKTAHGCQIKEYTDYYYDYTKAQVEAFDLGTPDQGWFYSAPLIRPDGNGRYMIIVNREQAIAIDKGEHRSVATPFSTTDTEVKHNQTALSSLGTVAAGVIKRLRARLNKRNCTWDQEVDTENAIAVSKSAVTIRDNAEFSETLAVADNQTTTPSVSDQKGVIKKLEASLNRFKLWSTRLVTTTSKPWDLTFTIDTHPNVTETYIQKGNQRTISMPTRPTGKLQSLAGFKRNADETYNWRVRQRDYDSGLGTGNTATTYSRYKNEYETEDGVKYYRTYQYSTTPKQFATLSEAIAWSASGNIVNPYKPYSKLGDFEYLGFKETQIVGSWFKVSDGTPR